ncbi:hypothetical protein [Paraburkholderia antibiotica]|uniref:Uncharacterized protein n=1 Tax=Paraburkholderia antibiotica TaxID=2728839 RepID=A0A7X9X7J6_9BURK|nr:hypothetical protein [Paraburkholderia antibiotica]NML32412.1 hypothetical protein [Paraburkholderia antibiotica]
MTTVGVLGKLGVANATAEQPQPQAVPTVNASTMPRSLNEASRADAKTAALKLASNGDDGGDDGDDGHDGHGAKHRKHHGDDGDSGDDGHDGDGHDGDDGA